MRLAAFGPLVLLTGTEPTRVELLRALLEDTRMTAEDAENAQAEREVASQARDTDPEPGAFYGLPDAPTPEPAPDTPLTPTRPMPDINDAFPSNYLKASDLGDDNVLVTIDAVKFEEFDGDNGEKERRPIVYFRGKKKGLVLNKTNARKIAELLQSSDTDDWAGGQIKLYATETTFQGRATPCIRVKQAALPSRQEKAKYTPPPVAVAEREPGEDDSDIPF